MDGPASPHPPLIHETPHLNHPFRVTALIYIYIVLFAIVMILLRQLPRYLPRSVVAIAPRPLSTSTLLHAQRIPSLSDVTHSEESTTEFKTRVSAFRKQLRTNKKNAEAKTPIPAENKGLVKSILYGSEQGQKEEREMEQSYGKVLARGKYVHAIEFHHVKPEKVAEYVHLVGDVYPDIAGKKENSCHLVGSWKTEIGDFETFGKFVNCYHAIIECDVVIGMITGSDLLTRFTVSPYLGVPRM